MDNLSKYGMLPIAGSPTAGIDVNNPEVKAAIQRLVTKGMPVTKVNIAEELAAGSGTHVMPDGTSMPNAAMPGRGGPSSGIVAGKEAAEAARLQAEKDRQAAEMQERYRQIRARKAQVQ